MVRTIQHLLNETWTSASHWTVNVCLLQFCWSTCKSHCTIDTKPAYDAAWLTRTGQSITIDRQCQL